MRGFDHAKILSPGFHGLRKERLAQCLPIYVQDTTKNALQIMSLAAYSIPWVPETFLARFPVLSSLFLAASPLVALAFGQHRKFPPRARKTSGPQGTYASETNNSNVVASRHI